MTRTLRITRTGHPVVLEIDARVWMNRLSQRDGRRVRLGDVPEEDLESIAATGCDLLWLMGVWTVGPAARAVARRRLGARADQGGGSAALDPDSIVGSPYAVADYTVPRGLGGDDGLARLREQLSALGVGLMLDFVPNHTGIDHRWVRDHPDWYVQGEPGRVEAEPDGWFWVRSAGGRVALAHGRDPNFPSWQDTAQLDYRVAAVHAAMTDQLMQIALRCDGVRCDMAMLMLDDVFRATWCERGAPPPAGDAPVGEFWWHAIAAVRRPYPRFLLLAEAYWGLEHRLQQLGFDHTYDKTLLDRLRHAPGEHVADHLRADLGYQSRSMRYLENHDEPRAATVLSPARQRSAALVAATVPGMLLLHDGQTLGSRVHVPVEVDRHPAEPVDGDIARFYDRLLGAIDSDVFRQGTPFRIEPRATWEGDGTHASVVAWLWIGPRGSLRLAAANLGDSVSRCFLPLTIPDLRGRTIVLEDLVTDATYERAGDDLIGQGLFLELPPGGHHLFRITGHRGRCTSGSAR